MRCRKIREMNAGYLVLVILLITLFSVSGYAGQDGTEKIKKDLQPPKVRKTEKLLTIHGHTRIDYYYWLNQRENPEVIKHLEAENRYKDMELKSTVDLQKKIYNEIVGRIKKSDRSVPYRYQGYYYYYRYKAGGEYPLYCRKPDSLKNEEEILLDVNKMAKGYNFFHVSKHSVSPNNNLLAYGVDTVSRRKYKIYFKNLKTGNVLKDVLTNTTGRAVWAGDNQTVFYSTKDKTLRAYKIFKHILGTDVSKDKEIFHETDPTFSTYVFKSKSREYIFIASFHTLSSEYRFVRADRPHDEFKVIQKREKNLEYDVEQYGDFFYIKTNNQAKNFKLVKTPIASPAKENWQDVISHRKDVLLTGFEIFRNFLVLGERKEGLRQLRVRRWNGGEDYYIGFKEEAYLSYIHTNPEFETDVVRYGYSSLTTPSSVFDYDMVNRKNELLKQEEVVGDFSSENYQSERFYVTVRDNTRVPVSLVYKRGVKRDGKNPLLLYGYGSYGASMDPYFRSDRLSLLDRGFVFAIAHIRGGQEMGRWWYEDGKLLKKKNTFYDFIDCAKYLIQEKYTCSEKLFAIGGSAGGLLMGAVVNMAPTLFKGVIAGVPWVDVVTTMLDDTIPLTTAEYDEWGDPRQQDYYQYMLSYSPYDNVDSKPYPAMLVTTGFHDSQVQYFEPAKWVQKLREKSTSRNKILFHINMEAGHGGVSGRFRKHKETALEYVFMLHLLGISQ